MPYKGRVKDIVNFIDITHVMLRVRNQNSQPTRLLHPCLSSDDVCRQTVFITSAAIRALCAVGKHFPPGTQYLPETNIADMEA
ncbi:unnamed protein product [Clavelina lepadiformis]|uniref:Uncharacterized protein n=1 Tax=Clavelina lepadiformis TaxID=159417 RepID=A0ABP0G7Q9_CLALP